MSSSTRLTAEPAPHKAPRSTSERLSSESKLSEINRRRSETAARASNRPPPMIPPAGPTSGTPESDDEESISLGSISMGENTPPRASHRPGPLGGMSDPLLDRLINDRFRIVSLIAKGGMGRVYRAEQAPLGREVALKVLHPNYTGDGDPEFHRRFFLEASTTAKLTHPNTVSIFDYGRTDDDIYYIAMELLEGKTLYRALREQAPFEPDRALHIARQICRSLREAHSLGVIHRDLKPANIFLLRHGDEEDFVKVLDFGLVKNLDEAANEHLTQTGLFMGSPKYMAPEQIRGEDIDGRADVYSLGIILYEMLTGRVPFERGNSVNTLMAHVHEAPPSVHSINPSVTIPQSLGLIVHKALAKMPDERFASMDEFLLAMRRAGAESGHMLSQSRELSGDFAIPALTSSSSPVTISGEALPSAPPSSELAVPEENTDLSGSIATQREAAGSGRRDGLTLMVGALSALVIVLAGVIAYRYRSPDEPSAALMPSAAGAPQNSSSAQDGPSEHAAAQGVSADGMTADGMTAERGVSEDQADAEDRSDSERQRSAEQESSPSATLEPSGQGERRADEETGEDVAPPARARIVLHSEPEGAAVYVRTADGETQRYGPTPTEVEWSGADAEPGREVSFVFRLRGHRPFTATRTVRGEELAIEAELHEIERAPRRQRNRAQRPRPEPTRAPRIITTPGGFKADPY